MRHFKTIALTQEVPLLSSVSQSRAGQYIGHEEKGRAKGTQVRKARNSKPVAAVNLMHLREPRTH